MRQGDTEMRYRTDELIKREGETRTWIHKGWLTETKEIVMDREIIVEMTYIHTCFGL